MLIEVFLKYSFEFLESRLGYLNLYKCILSSEIYKDLRGENLEIFKKELVEKSPQTEPNRELLFIWLYFNYESLNLEITPEMKNLREDFRRCLRELSKD